MVVREHIETFLRINGISLTAPDDEIREALVYARWHERDVDAAIVLIRGSADEISEIHNETQDPLRAHGSVSHDVLASLLGLNVSLSSSQSLELTRQEKKRSARTKVYFILMFIVACIGAFILGAFLMYTSHLGPFYSPIQ